MSNASSFTFAKGNARKLVSVPLYGLGKLASLVVPRKANAWVFGSGSAGGEGALALLHEVRRCQPSIQAVWVVSSPAQREMARTNHIRWVDRSSLRGFWCTLRASTIVLTHGFGDVNRFGIFGAFIVQLWHGIPLKKLHLDTEVTLRAKRGFGGVLRRMYRSGGKATSLFVVASETVGLRIRSAFGLDAANIAPIGDPRDDTLIHADSKASRSAVFELLALEEDDSRLVLYAPTWRDGETDPAVPSGDEWQAIAKWATAMDARLIVRAHPLGVGAYEAGVSDRIHLLSSDLCADVTPLLGAFDALITDYSSIAFDYSLSGGPIIWFAPDLASYQASRGFYESYESVTEGAFVTHWPAVLESTTSVFCDDDVRAANGARTERLANRLFAHRDGNSSTRVLQEILQRRGQIDSLDAPDANLSGAQAPAATVYFESFYGRQVSCNPRALDSEIARVAPDVRRVWAVESVLTEVPVGAIRAVIGTPQAKRARAQADLVIVNDWLRRDFRPAKEQTVLQTWHGTMLKKLALDRAHVPLRTRLATLRESRKWDILLSQNDHCTTHLRSSYGYRGAVWQVGYPRNDELATLTKAEAKQRLGLNANMRVLAYAPTWRDRQQGLVDLLDVAAFAERLPSDWVLLVRGHTRTHEFGAYPELKHKLVDVSNWSNVNDVIAASDLFVTDYSSLMFDVSAANVPLAFFVPDLAGYRDHERGFTFDFAEDAPGPLLETPDQLLNAVEHLDALQAEYSERYGAWRKRFNTYDDGSAAERVVSRLISDGTLKTSHSAREANHTA